MLVLFTQLIDGCIGASGSGPYVLTFSNGSKRDATAAEVLSVQAAFDAKKAQHDANKAARQELRDNFSQWRDKLIAVRDEAAWTNAKRDAVLKDLAQVQIKILGVVKTLALD